ncbi:CRISPR-associated protein Cas4 [Clostridium polynesiense]|uniref:CRISPR-associated protein Cas4 n=1 Tax=Clostridium polynesiense TaxID=1325933 RepID=UPI00058EF5AB|nr:CRISPR-associated protein Cas4 [Clostridium polynesiense]
MEVNGTLIWYFNICKREVWLMGRNIIPDQKDDNIDIGRFIHEESYKRQDKEISFGNVKFDVLFKDKDRLVIGETKKSSKFQEASRWQLLYYLYQLKLSGIKAEGLLLYPEEKKRVSVILSDVEEKRLEDMVDEINKILLANKPEAPEKKGFCKSCGYREYCYS